MDIVFLYIFFYIIIKKYYRKKILTLLHLERIDLLLSSEIARKC